MTLRINFLNVVLLVLLLQTSNLYSQGHVLRFKNINSEQGLTDNRITAVMQDAMGMLWAGNKISINRFDGEKTKVYQIGHNNNIYQFVEDSNQNVWVATQQGLYIFDQNTDAFIKIKSNVEEINKLLNSTIFCILNTRDDELLISGKADFLVKLKVDKTGNVIEDSITTLQTPNNSGFVTKILKGLNSRVWLGTDHGKILHIENDIIKESDFVTAGNTSMINDIAIDKFSNLWIGTNENGLYRYNFENHFTEHFYKGDAIHSQTINNNIVTKVYAEENNVWIGTDGGGLNLYVQNEKRFTYYRYNSGNELSISDNTILDIQSGLNDIILLGTVHGGISLFRTNNKIENIPAKNFNFSYQDPQGSRVLEDSDKNIWLSAGRTGLRRYNPKTKQLNIFSNNESRSGFSGNIVLSLFEDQNKRLWAGTLRGGINVFDLKSDKFIDLPKSKEITGVFAISEDDEGNMWVGHRNGILIYDGNLKISSEITQISDTSTKSNQVTSLYKDVAGVMWVGTTGGLIKLEKNVDDFLKTSYYHDDLDENSLSDNHILSIQETHDFSILIGTYGHGLNKYVRETGKFERLNSGNEIKGNIIRGILKDKEKNIWLSTNAGLTQIDLKNEITNYGIIEGIPPFNGGYASLDSKGNLLMAGVFGLSYFQPEKLKNTNYSPHVNFTSVKAVNNENEMNYSFSELANESITIEPNNKLLNINFSSSELYAKSNISYQYSMKGLDGDWQDLGKQNNISFSNLKPGNYQLKVRATNNLKFWGLNYSTLNIKVKPSFWQRPIVKGLQILILILLLVLVYRIRVSAVNKQKNKLQRLLELKTLEIKEHEHNISESKISILEMEKQNQVLKQIKLEDQLRFKIDELMNSTVRTMHKNNLLNDIKNKLKLQLKNDSLSKERMKEIVGDIDDSFILDKDWESFYTLFNQVHPSFIKDLKGHCTKLSERDIQLCALIKLNFSSQHIATLFGISLSSVKVARHRLRKKLNIGEANTLKGFLADFSTVDSY